MKRTMGCLAAVLLSLLAVCAGAENRLVLPSSLRVISEEALYGSSALDSVQLPDQLQEIHARAFAQCALKQINLPASVEFIADDAFDGNPGLDIQALRGTYGYRWARQMGFTLNGGEVYPRSIALSPKELTLTVGESATVTAALDPAQVTYPGIEWISGDPDVAVVSQGRVTAVGAGSTLISAVAEELGEESVADTCTVVVYDPVPAAQTLTAQVQVDSVLLSWSRVDIAQGYVVDRAEKINGDYQAVATLNSREVLSWRDTPERDKAFYYRVRPVLPGDRGVYSGAVEAVVRSPQVEISQAALTLRVGDTAQLSVQTEAHYGVYLATLWTSSDESVATVDENTGLVRVVGEGSAVISAWEAGWTVTCRITARAAIKLDRPKISDVRAIWKDTLRVEWSHVANAVGYNVYRSTARYGTYTQIGRVRLLDTQKAVGDLVAFEDATATEETYYYKICAFAENGTTSALSSAKHKTVLKALSTPRGVSVTTAPTGLRITWEENADYDDSTAFFVLRSDREDGRYEQTGYADQGEGFAYLDEEAADGRTYWYRVQAMTVSDTGAIAGFSLESGVVSGQYDMSIVFVESISLTGINMLEDYEELAVGDTLKLGARISPSNATNPNVLWRSTAPEVASVDESGLVTAVRPGVARIFCTAEGNPEVRVRRDFLVEEGGTATEADYLFLTHDEPGCRVQIKASGDWTATAADWITLDSSAGSGDAVLSYALEESDDLPRTGQITVVCGTERATLSVTQEERPTDVHVQYGGGTTVWDGFTLTHPTLGTLIENDVRNVEEIEVYNGAGVMNFTFSGAARFSAWTIASWMTCEQVSDRTLRLSILGGLEEPGAYRLGNLVLEADGELFVIDVRQQAPSIRITHSYNGKTFENWNGEGSQTFEMLTANDGASANLTVESTHPWTAQIVSSSSDWLELSTTRTRLTLTNKAGSDTGKEQTARIQIGIAQYAPLYIEVSRPSSYNADQLINQNNYGDQDADLYYYAQDMTARTIKSSGCGLCAICNAVYYLTNQMPDVHEVARYARENKKYTVGKGTNAEMYKDYATDVLKPVYGISWYHTQSKDTDLSQAKKLVREGKAVVISASRPVNDVTASHIMVLVDYDESKGFRILDSAGPSGNWTKALDSWVKVKSDRTFMNSAEQTITLQSEYSYYSL